MQTNKEKHLAQSGWSLNQVDHLRAQFHIKQPKLNVSQAISSKSVNKPKKQASEPKSKPTTVKTVQVKNNHPDKYLFNSKLTPIDQLKHLTHSYKNQRLDITLPEFKKVLHNPDFNFLILDLEFYTTATQATVATTHIEQIAGRVFNSHDRFNYYNMNTSMRPRDQIEILKATNAQYGELQHSDMIDNIIPKVNQFCQTHHITHVISWDNGTDISELNYWENHFNTVPTIPTKAQWIDLADIIGKIVNNHKPTLEQFCEYFGMQTDDVAFHHADVDTKMIDKLCHIYYNLENNAI